jgi:hypothetical protein
MSLPNPLIGREPGFILVHTFPPPDIEARWRAFIKRADVASHYVSPEFFREPFFKDLRPFAILAIDKSEVTGVASGIHQGNAVVCGIAQRPQVALDKTADQAATADLLAQGVLAEARGAELIRVYAWSPLNILGRHGFRSRQEEGVVMLDPSSGAESLFRRFSKGRKAAIRSAIRQGVEVRQAEGNEYYLEYYELQRGWCLKKGIPLMPLEVLEEAYKLRDNRRLFLAYYSGKIVAGSVVRFVPGGLLEYAANNSLEEFLHLKPNDLLQWRIIEWACAEGFQSYSLGGVHLFVRTFGGTIVPTYRYQLDLTFFRKHVFQEGVGAALREAFLRLPEPIQTSIRRLVKKTRPEA